MALDDDGRDLLAWANRQTVRPRETLERHRRELADLTPTAEGDLKEADDALKALAAVEAALGEALQEKENG